MFNPQQSNGSASPNKGSAMSQAISLMGTLGGVFAAITMTPLLYAASKTPMSEFLHEAWGPGLAPMLMWVTGAGECILIYVAVKLFVISLVTWAVMSLARRFSF